MKHVIFKSAQVNSFCLDALKRIEKIIRENVFELKKKKPELPRVSANRPTINWAQGHI